MGVSTLLAACDASPEAGGGGAPSPSVEAEPVFRQARAVAERLARLRKAAADVSALAEQPCPDEAIGRALGLGAGKLLSVDYDYLERYAGGGAHQATRGSASAPSASHQAERGEGPWGFLTTPALRAVRAPVELESKQAAVDMVFRFQELERDHPYAAVIRATERRAPAMQGERFVAGALSGWVVVARLDSGERLCQASFETVTPEDIAVPVGTDRDKALLRDLTMRARGALDDAVGRITRVLTLDLG